MTESDWNSSSDPQAMFTFLRERSTLNRDKLRLFVEASCPGMGDLLDNESFLNVLESGASEAYGLDDLAELATGWDGTTFVEGADIPSGKIRPLPRARLRPALSTVSSRDSARSQSEAVTNYFLLLGPSFGVGSDKQAMLIRCIFGNPLHHISFNKAWRTSDCLAMARGMYETRDFAAMPILADALQDAGCEDGGILDHCRKHPIHVRGCFVVDMLLEKH